MTEHERDTAAQAAVNSLLRGRKMTALAVAVLVASTSATAGCTLVPTNQPCPGTASGEPCVQPSGNTASWLAPPRWPAQESGPGGSGGEHLGSRADFVANPQYTGLRAGQSSGGSMTTGGPTYYGGSHSYYYHVYSSGGGGGWSSEGAGGHGGGVSG